MYIFLTILVTLRGAGMRRSDGKEPISEKKSSFWVGSIFSGNAYLYR